MGIGKRILSVLIGILFIISVSVLGGSLLAGTCQSNQSGRD